MTDRQGQLCVLVVDKALLALVVGVSAFYLNKALERHKARSVYYQKLTDEKIAAYRTLSGVLIEYYDSARGLAEKVRVASQKPTPQLLTERRKINEAVFSFNERRIQSWGTIVPTTLFVPGRTMRKM